MDEFLSYVYILANLLNGTLYTGVTSNVHKKIYEHKNDVGMQSIALFLR